MELKNKLISELQQRFCLSKDFHRSEKIIYKMYQILKQTNLVTSPTYLIETAVFNILIPVSLQVTQNKKVVFTGKFLRQIIIKALFTIIKYAKHMSINQTISYRLAIIFIKLYKKDHILYKQKILYLNKILNI